MPSLVFVDTSILLDAYRAPRGDSSLKLLQRINEHHERIICTAQVEMEFKKNRQAVILRTLDTMKMPTLDVPRPSVLMESRPSKGLTKTSEELKTHVKNMKLRAAKLLENPKSDPVHRVVQRLFKARGEFHLHKDHPRRNAVRHLARKRFFLGYPPRKASDTSYGDAINWEWIIDCAQRKRSDVVIVSRDKDFGLTISGKAVVNDWLAQEFRERVGRSRSISLTQRLSEGLDAVKIDVSEAERKDEKRLLEDDGKWMTDEGRVIALIVPQNESESDFQKEIIRGMPSAQCLSAQTERSGERTMTFLVTDDEEWTSFWGLPSGES